MGTIQENLIEDILTEQVHKVIKSEGLNHYEIKIKFVPNTGSNYTGAIYLITVENKDGDNFELFAKVANGTEAVRKVMAITIMYAREFFVYHEIANLYNDLQDKIVVPDAERFMFPKHYYSDSKEMQETLILENLSVRGYDVLDRLKCIDWNYASKAIKQLAKYHALSFAFEDDNPELFNKIIVDKDDYIFSNNKVNDEQQSAYTQRLIKTILECLPSENREKFQKFLGTSFSLNLWKDMCGVQRRPVFVHGDYRPSNLMAKYKEDVVTDIVPVDYQRARYGTPVNDLLYFIFTSSDEQFRRDYYEAAVEHYHTCLTDFLTLLGKNVNDLYPKHEYEMDVKEHTMYGLLLSIFILPYILIDDKPDFNKDLNDISVSLSNTYIERFNGIVNDYVRWGYL